ncbi:hypothetical protein TNCV_1723791, partial [Trichonephila clavipes]
MHFVHKDKSSSRKRAKHQGSQSNASSLFTIVKSQGTYSATSGMNFFQLRLSMNRTSLLRFKESQAVSPHQGLVTLPGTINIHDMGWRPSHAPHAQRTRLFCFF